MTESLRASSSDSLIVPGIIPQISERSFGETSQDNIDLSHAVLNPDLLKEKEKLEEDIPIWQSKKAELYFSNPNLERYVIWKYNPGEEGVVKFPKFGVNDPLSHHYYKSREEYEEAFREYKNCSYPDKLIDLNIFFSNF